MRLFNLWPVRKPVSAFAMKNLSAMNDRSKRLWLTVMLLLAFAGSALAQEKQQNETLLINGYSGKADITRTGVHEYIDIRDLARITNGSLSFKENFVVLTLPAPRIVMAAANPPANPPAEAVGFSKGFMQAGIEAMASMREWRSALAALLRDGIPVGKGMADYRGRAHDSLMLATAAASTPSDQSGMQLLTNEFDNVETWSDNLVQASNSMDTANYAITDDTLSNDPLFQKIVQCGQFLAPMLASGNFEDDTSCH